MATPKREGTSEGERNFEEGRPACLPTSRNPRATTAASEFHPGRPKKPPTEPPGPVDRAIPSWTTTTPPAPPEEERRWVAWVVPTPTTAMWKRRWRRWPRLRPREQQRPKPRAAPP